MYTCITVLSDNYYTGPLIGYVVNELTYFKHQPNPAPTAPAPAARPPLLGRSYYLRLTTVWLHQDYVGAHVWPDDWGMTENPYEYYGGSQSRESWVPGEVCA